MVALSQPNVVEEGPEELTPPVDSHGNLQGIGEGLWKSPRLPTNCPCLIATLSESFSHLHLMKLFSYS